MGVGRLARGIEASAVRTKLLKSLLDTHFVLWIVTGADRLRSFPWLDCYRPWGLTLIAG